MGRLLLAQGMHWRGNVADDEAGQPVLNKLEELDRRVWDGRQVLEDVTHVLGGDGVGLLLYSVVAGWARPIGYALIGLSVLLHVYALVASQSKASPTERITRLAA